MVARLGNKIKQVLEQQGFQRVSPTDKKLEELGMDRNRFTRMLNNYTQPSFSELKRIAEWLKVEMDELIIEEEKENVPRD